MRCASDWGVEVAGAAVSGVVSGCLDGPKQPQWRALVRLTISELAKVTGPTARTLRFYDEVGLVPPAGTTPSGKHSTVKYGTTRGCAGRYSDLPRRCHRFARLVVPGEDAGGKEFWPA